jgi:diguanylate cyclase (GGDEF)-like protein
MKLVSPAGASAPTLAAGTADAAGAPRGGAPVEVTPAFTVLDGPGLGDCHRLAGDRRTLVFGRGTAAHVRLADPTVSRLHARAFVVLAAGGGGGGAERVRIVDMGSRNGTHVNGVRVGESCLAAGDKIHLGDVLLRFDLLDPREARFMDEVASRIRDAATDPLTGLAQRSVLAREGAGRLARCQARGEPCALLMIDLDRFKQLNDRYGHAAGDEALRAAGRAVRAAVRECDLAARYGGEEFVVLLAGAGRAEALAVARRIAVELASTPLPGLPPDERITASQGLSVAGAAGAAETLEELLRRADLALLRAKRAGRDRIEHASVASARSPSVGS